MARPGLMRHRKFARLASMVGGEAVARGVLELIWDSAYECGDAYLGLAVDVELAGRWRGEPGALVAALVSCGSPGCGFVEEIPGRPGEYQVHDLLDHAPDYVRKRLARETLRKSRGNGADGTGRECPVSDRSVTGQCPENGRTPAPAPAPTQKYEEDNPLPAADAAGSLVSAVGGSRQPDPQPDTGRVRRRREAVRGTDGFEAWWEMYRRRTGRGTEKAGTLEAYQRLSPEDRAALVERTEGWFAARERLAAAGVFVAEAPDPIRFIRRRRWEDELGPPGGGVEVAPREATPTETLIREQLAHEDDPRWREYRALVVSRRLDAGSWDRWVAGEVEPREVGG